MKIDVYDFDKTIYHGDSTVDFYLYCAKHRPYILVCIPVQAFGFLLYKLKKCDKTRLKEYFFCFLKLLTDVDTLLDGFYTKSKCKLEEWYINKSHDNDVIISASPQFLVSRFVAELGVKMLIASDVSKEDGKFASPNCYGAEKLARMQHSIPDFEVGEFYSDSLSDLPLARLSVCAFFVADGKPHKWEIS